MWSLTICVWLITCNVWEPSFYYVKICKLYGNFNIIDMHKACEALVNPLSPNSVQSLLSPHSVTISVTIQVMRIKVMIIKHKMSWCLTKFSEPVVCKIWEDQLREYLCWCQGLEDWRSWYWCFNYNMIITCNSYLNLWL